MKKIKSFEKYNLSIEMAQDFLNSLDLPLNESDEKKDYKSIQDEELKKLKSGVSGDVKLNFGLVGTFGAGIGALYPMVEGLLSKSSYEIDTRSVVLLTIAAVYMIVLEENKHARVEEEQIKQLEKETGAILEELKLAGFPNAKTGTKNGTDNKILGKIVNALKSVKGIFNSLSSWFERQGSSFYKRAGATMLGGFADMLAYTGMLIPIMNGINALIGIYNMDLSSFAENALMLVSAIGIIIMKHGVAYLVGKFKNFLDLSDKQKKQLKSDLEEIETPLIKRI